MFDFWGFGLDKDSRHIIFIHDCAPSQVESTITRSFAQKLVFDKLQLNNLLNMWCHVQQYNILKCPKIFQWAFQPHYDLEHMTRDTDYDFSVAM